MQAKFLIFFKISPSLSFLLLLSAYTCTFLTLPLTQENRPNRFFNFRAIKQMVRYLRVWLRARGVEDQQFRSEQLQVSIFFTTTRAVSDCYPEVRLLYFLLLLLCFLLFTLSVKYVGASHLKLFLLFNHNFNSLCFCFVFFFTGFFRQE